MRVIEHQWRALPGLACPTEPAEPEVPVDRRVDGPGLPPDFGEELRSTEEKNRL
jgi:hypothetical protein